MKSSKWVVLVLVLVPMMSLVSLKPEQSPDCSCAPVGYHDTNVKVLAAYQVWFGLESHRCAFSGEPLLPNKRPYDSLDTEVIIRHIQEAKERGIDGFVVDWYGPKDNVTKDLERDHMNRATIELFRLAELLDFRVALMYDDQTAKIAVSDLDDPYFPNNPANSDEYEPRVIKDLQYAELEYFKSPAYLEINGCPALFIFPDDIVKPHLNWMNIRNQLSLPVTLIDRDPNPEEPEYDACFDGFYAWVTATKGQWHPEGLEWGWEYLKWFYETMQDTNPTPAFPFTPYANKVAVGGVWPGFDDSLAFWSENRFMARFGTRTHDKTLKLAEDYNVEYIMVETWNDFEEGTDIEYGVRMLVDMDKPDPELLIRSTPIVVCWSSDRDSDALQVYAGHEKIHDQHHSPGTYLSLTPGNIYELKIWLSGSPDPLQKWVKIRRVDPVPDVVPVVVEPKTITVTSPNSGESWPVNSSQTITWTSTGSVGNVKIQYSLDNGCNWSDITSSTENDGSFPWTVPDMVSNKCLIRVSETDGVSAGTSAMFSILPIPSITVTSPNGGESWETDSSQNITWTTAGTVDNVKIEFNNGEDWTEIIASTENDGSHPWTVPDVDSDHCLIRISETDGNPSDTSDTVFTIFPPSITVTSPNGGENWDVGSQQIITWTSEVNEGNVLIEYSVNNGVAWITIAQSTVNDGKYYWRIPNRPSNYCLVRVTELDGDGEPLDVRDVSDALFSIVSTDPESVTLRSPNGGESWTAGSAQQIEWNTTGEIDRVTINYSTDNGTTWKTIAKNAPNNYGYNWVVPATVSDNCLVRVSAKNSDLDPKPSDVSDAVFSIVLPATPTIEVIAPNGGEQLTVGPRFTITWNAFNTREDVRIEYSVNGGDTWAEITGSTENNGKYDWDVPDEPSDNCLVRVSETSGQASDTSDAVFSIVSPSPGDITVTSPNGGESWTAGALQEIKWDSSSGDSVKIEYSRDNGTTWETIVQATPNNGNFDWTLPETVSSDECLVRITSNDASTDPIPSDTSDAVFSIVQTNYYNLLKENCANNHDIFYEDFNQNFEEVDSSQNQWSIGGNTWWFPHHDGEAPQVQNSSLILSSEKSESTSTFIKQEAQKLEGFPLPENGELIIGLWSERWANVPTFDDDYWADSSVGLELFIGSEHYGIVFTYGHLGVFYDPTGNCQHPNAVCQYAQVDGWSDFVTTDKPIAIRITWTPEGDTKTFKFYIITETNEDTEPRAIISNVDYIGSEGLRIRLNANVTDTDKEPAEDSDTLKIDYVCLRSEVEETPPTVTVTSPNGGESWLAGSTQVIKWNSTGDINNVTIYYSRNNGTTWKVISQNTSNDGRFYWVVPRKASEQCLIRVTANDNDLDPKPSDVSDAVFSILLPSTPTIEVIAPNGGEQLAVDSLFTITWNAANTREDVRIEYSVNGGDAWAEITGSTENNGKYDWIVPDEPSDNCLVRISESGGQASDISDAVFSIVSPTPGDITVTSPNGGESWTAGSSQEIKWTSSGGIDGVKIEYSQDNGTTWKTIVQTTPNSGTFAWILPDIASDECLVRITSNDASTDPIPSDISDTVFSIAPPASPAIRVITPNGGEQLPVGSQYDITWFSRETREAVKIEYSVNGGDPWVEIVAAAENDGKYEWIVPDTPSETCLVRISETDGQPVDISDAVFSIIEPVPGEITVISPNGGENWTVGSLKEITWTAGGINNVTIEYSIDYGTTWQLIVQTTPNNGSFDWTIPDTVSDECLVRISSNDSDPDPKPSDTSDRVFSIVPDLAGEFRVISPNGGEEWEVGSTQAITWTGTGDINSVMIEYSYDNGNTWSTIVSSTGNSGAYDWTIPDTVSDECLVRISSNDSDPDPKPSDTSDQVFSIVPDLAGEFRVISPNGGEEWEVGSIQAITWTGSGDINSVMIEYSYDNGNTWNIIVSSAGNSGAYDWPVPDTVSGECLVRVTANDGDSDPKPSDVSDAVFSILLPSSPTIRVITPNGGEQLVIGSIYEITWFGTDSRANVKIEYSINGGDTWTEIIGSTENDGDYDWTVPDEPSEICWVRISGLEGQPVDVSDAVFSIVQPLPGDLTVLTPNGGENLETGSEYNISWTCSGINNVIIEYSVNNGATWLYIDKVPADNGSYTWTVPGTPSEVCLVRVIGADSDENPSDVSDEVFTIFDPSQASIEVFTPNGGESLSVGEEYYITWASSGISSVKIDYSTNNGEEWIPIDTVSAIGGRYTWTVPDTPSDSCLIRITGNDSPEDPSDVSDSVFSITSN